MAINWTPFVEGHLIGIDVQDVERIVRIHLCNVAHQSSTVTLSGVDRFVVYEMRESNIIDRITSWDGLAEETDFRGALVLLVTGKEEGEADAAFSPVVDRAIDSIRREGKILLEIEPVYGAHVIALAAKISIENTSYGAKELPAKENSC